MAGGTEDLVRRRLFRKIRQHTKKLNEIAASYAEMAEPMEDESTNYLVVIERIGATLLQDVSDLGKQLLPLFEEKESDDADAV